MREPVQIISVTVAAELVVIMAVIIAAATIVNGSAIWAAVQSWVVG